MCLGGCEVVDRAAGPIVAGGEFQEPAIGRVVQQETPFPVFDVNGVGDRIDDGAQELKLASQFALDRLTGGNFCGKLCIGAR